MDPLAIAPGEENEESSIPDIPHVEIMFDALEDTANGVTGTEGFGLTEAQRYAEGVLMASGSLRASSIDGNESFFSKIGGGIKATYDYIVKMFKSVWEFFFKRDVGKEVDAAVAEVKELAAEVAAVGNSSDAKTVEDQFDKMRKASIAAAAESDKNAFIGRLKEAGLDLNAKKELVKEMATELPKVNKDAQNRFKLAAMAVIDAKTKYIGVVEKAEGDEGTKFNLTEDLAKSIVGEAKAIVPKEQAVITALKGREEVKSKSDAEALAKLIVDNLNGVKTLAASFSKHSPQVSTKIKECQEFIAKSSKADPSDANYVAKHKNTELGMLRGILSFTTAIAQSMKKTISVQVDLQHRTNKVFGL